MHVRQLAVASQFDPDVVWAARAIVTSAAPFDRTGYCWAIRRFCESHFRFVYDARDADVLVSPRELLARLPVDGEIRGDCDENACLAAGLGLCVGLDSQLVLCGFGEPDAPLTHVWSELRADVDSEWVSMDVTHPGTETDPISRIEIIPI